MSPRNRFIIGAVTGYGVFAATWIVVSDRLLAMMVGPDQLAAFGTAKGLTFVAATTVLLALCLGNVPAEDEPAAPSGIGHRIGRRRLAAALALPLVAFALQSAFWAEISPLIWFLFYPAVFFSSWVGGLAGGVAATVLSTLLVWYAFIPPAFSLVLEKQTSIISIGVFFAMGILFALTHHRLRAAERRAADNKFRALVDQALAGIYIIQDGRFRYVNPALARMFGYTSPAEIIDSVPALDLVAPEQRARVEENIRRRVEGEAVEMRYTFQGLRRDGGLIDVEIHGRAFEFEGQPAVIGLALDVSERKRSEATLRTTVNQLTMINSELERIAVVTAHDLREPARAITTYAQLLERKSAARMTPEELEWLSYLAADARRLYDLIGGLLDYSRVPANLAEPHPVSAADACRDAHDNLAARIGESGATITVGDLPQVMADHILLVQVFQALIGNALKFRHPDRRPAIAITAKARGDQWLFSVSDNGIGFDPAEQDVFELFRQLGTRDQSMGVGVGLAICKRIVERLGGRVWVESLPGSGSTFGFSLTGVGTGATRTP